jgi:hypothetical protein
MQTYEYSYNMKWNEWPQRNSDSPLRHEETSGSEAEDEELALP